MRVGRDDEAVLLDVVSRAYPILLDDEALRRTVTWNPSERGKEFERLRRTYPTRREFRQTAVRMTGGLAALLESLRGLQFQLGSHSTT